MSGNDATALYARLKAAKRLPSPAGTAMRVLELCRSEDTGLKEISIVIGSDPALAARLLKFANSAATGLNREVTSVREAVLLMGVRSVKLAALGFSLALPGTGPACPGFDLQQYWSEACAAAVVARAIAKTPFKCEPEEAFTAGLVAKLGRLAMAQGVPEEYTTALKLAAQGSTMVEAERRVFGTDHAEFTAHLLRDWSLPQVLVDAVRWQFDPSQALKKSAELAQAIGAAYAVAPAFVGGQLSPAAKAAVRRVVTDDLGLDEKGWGAFAGAVRQAYEEAAAAMNITVSPQAAMDLYAEAQEEAARVGIVAQLEKARAASDAQDLLRRATTDALTGVANRAKFDERIAELVKGVSRGHEGFALIMIDIDHFKKFNDTHGHQVGDLVLSRVAKALQNSLRDVDLLARYGGEEFAILAPATGREGACRLAVRTQLCVEALKVQTDGKQLTVTASLGVAVTSDFQPGATAEAVIAEADKQLYAAKNTGRNTWAYRGVIASVVQASQKAA